MPLPTSTRVGIMSIWELGWSSTELGRTCKDNSFGEIIVPDYLAGPPHYAWHPDSTFLCCLELSSSVGMLTMREDT